MNWSGGVGATSNLESPFSDAYADGGQGNRWEGRSDAQPKALLGESPFLNEYALEGETVAVDPALEALAELLEELRDEEFDEALLSHPSLACDRAKFPQLRAIHESGEQIWG